MPRFYFEKLVRDKILDRCLEDPKVKTTYRTLSLLDFKKELVAKIHEEGDEVPIQDESDDEVIAELADVQTVIDELVAAYGLTKQDIQNAQDKKKSKNGNFEKRVYIEYVDLEDDSEWVEIFRAQPEKYREQ